MPGPTHASLVDLFVGHLPLVVELVNFKKVTSLSVGGKHACAILDDQTIKCWGANGSGQLGLGDNTPRGTTQDSLGNALPTVKLKSGLNPKSLHLGAEHSCVLFDNGAAQCWGRNANGELGLGDKNARGDGRTRWGDSLPLLNLGAAASIASLTAGGAHTCAILATGDLKCWGANYAGQLGLGATTSRGDDANEMGDSLPALNLGFNKLPKSVAAGGSHTCAFLDDGGLKCWGSNGAGQLGLGDKNARGDTANEMGDALPLVDLGPMAKATSVRLGADYTCRLLDPGDVKCWGTNVGGQLGIGNALTRGDEPNEMGASLASVLLLGCGDYMTCSNVCTDLKVDTSHCGACNNACGATSQCNAGACEACPLKLLAKVDYAVGKAPISVTTGDLNGDGKLDLVTASEMGDTVSVLLSNGNGTFQAKVDYSAPGPVSVTAGDLNGDGKVDLAVANYGVAAVSVRLNGACAP